MTQFHSLLIRQIRKYFPEGVVPAGIDNGFIEAVSRAYEQFDDDRQMVERSLDLSSQELMQANSELRAIFEAVPDLFFRLAPDGKIVDCKGARQSDFFLPASDLIGKHIQAIPVADVAEIFSVAVKTVTATQSIVTFDYELGKDGEARYFEARFIPIMTGNEILAIIRDISNWRRAAEELKHSLSLLQSTLESTADGILVVNLNAEIVSFNERFAQMWRIPDELLRSRDNNRALEYVAAQMKDPRGFLAKIQQLFETPDVDCADILEFQDGRVFERYSTAQRLDGQAIGRVWSFRDITAARQAEALRAADQQRLQTLSRKLVEAQETERRRIARELHDEIGQTLTGVKIAIQASRLELGQQCSGLDAAVEEVNSAIRRVRDLSLSLRPAMLDDLGLVATLHWYFDSIMQRSGINCEYLFRGAEKRLAPDLEIACFRVAQEALTNIVRHAKARNVKLTLMVKEKYVELIVADDGIGFNVRAARQRSARGDSMGLSAMNERVVLAGGTLIVRSKKGSGTTVRVRFPGTQ